ncbi:MAG: hypothetical protein ACI9VO_001543, partial [Colwellia sp.]
HGKYLNAHIVTFDVTKSEILHILLFHKLSP